MSKTVPVEEAVGMVLPHDITEIVKKSFKGRAFKKGHIITREDIPYLKRLGKDNIFVLDLEKDDIHENEAAEKLAQALAGKGTEVYGEPVEGKLSVSAAITGVLKIDVDALCDFNMLGEVMCSTLHTNRIVKQREIVASTRLIPLVTKRQIVDDAVSIASRNNGIIQVLSIRKVKVGLVITGNEVFHGRIQDAFEPVLRKKLSAIDSETISVRYAPDDVDRIAKEITTCLEYGADLIVTSGGMSVDPDDVTRQGIIAAGAKDVVYGTPVLPGAMFLVGYFPDNIPVLGLPACGMFHNITVFDLLLPRILSGEKITRKDIARLGHGGLCQQCKTCHFPACSFGK